jgi:hypothetical protein
MRLIVATLPDVKFNLGRDLILVKASSLYANETVLFSPTYAGTEPFLSFSDRPLIHQLVYLATLTREPGFKAGEKLTAKERQNRIREAKNRSDEFFSKADEVLHIIGYEKNADFASKELERVSREIASYVEAVSGIWSEDRGFIRRARELQDLQDAGLVRIQNIHFKPSLYFQKDRLKEQVTGELSRPDSYGVFDERFIAEFEELPEGPRDNMRVARIATDLLTRLPGFSAASVDELVDIRKELAPYTSGFRKSVLDLSAEIQSTPWHPDFAFEVEREIHRKVGPTVEQIESEIRHNSYLKEILRRAVKDPLVIPASSAFGLIVSNATGSSELIAQVASTVAGVGLIAAEALDDWKANRRRIRQNELFFYYKASELLEANT